MWITTGAMTQIFGLKLWHIGANGIIYALAAFLVVGGILIQNHKLICVSIGVIVLY